MQENIEHNLYAALKELVELKEMKGFFSSEANPENFMRHVEMESEYEKRKPLAWEAARKAIEDYEKNTK
jgi:hypothetical protein